MKYRLCLLLQTAILSVFACSTSWAANAPSSFAGKVVTLQPFGDQIGAFYYRMVALNGDGTYAYIVKQQASSREPFAQLSNYSDFRSQGTFVYQKTGDDTGTVTLSGTDGTSDSFDFTFTGEKTGSFTAGLYQRGNAGGSFSISAVADFQALPLINTALRGHVAPGQPLIAGFVVPGSVARTVLIRAVGPGLVKFGVTGTWPNPEFEIHAPASGRNFGWRYYGDWSDFDAAEAFQLAFNFVGAFPLTVGSKDAAEIVHLPPGSCTVVCSTSGADAGGEVLIEAYLLPE